MINGSNKIVPFSEPYPIPLSRTVKFIESPNKVSIIKSQYTKFNLRQKDKIYPTDKTQILNGNYIPKENTINSPQQYIVHLFPNNKFKYNHEELIKLEFNRGEYLFENNSDTNYDDWIKQDRDLDFAVDPQINTNSKYAIKTEYPIKIIKKEFTETNLLEQYKTYVKDPTQFLKGTYDSQNHNYDEDGHQFTTYNIKLNDGTDITFNSGEYFFQEQDSQINGGKRYRKSKKNRKSKKIKRTRRRNKRH
jgi:hypothetical protein